MSKLGWFQWFRVVRRGVVLLVEWTSGRDGVALFGRFRMLMGWCSGVYECADTLDSHPINTQPYNPRFLTTLDARDFRVRT